MASILPMDMSFGKDTLKLLLVVEVMLKNPKSIFRESLNPQIDILGNQGSADSAYSRSFKGKSI